MKPEFKVIPWLRKVREEHAAKQAGLSPAERLEQDRQAAAKIKTRLFKHRIPGRSYRPAASRVAEAGVSYGNK